MFCSVFFGQNTKKDSLLTLEKLEWSHMLFCNCLGFLLHCHHFSLGGSAVLLLLVLADFVGIPTYLR